MCRDRITMVAASMICSILFDMIFSSLIGIQLSKGFVLRSQTVSTVSDRVIKNLFDGGDKEVSYMNT